MSQDVKYPRGSRGAVLYPGTKVMIHGIKKAKQLNGVEGVCLEWHPEQLRMHVAMPDKSVKAFKTANLQKVVEKKAGKDDELDRVMAIFETADQDGNGALDKEEFENCLRGIGLGKSVLNAFMLAMDKDGDWEIKYDEFADWALGTDAKKGYGNRLKHSKSRLDVYWPEGHDSSKTEHVEDDDDDPSDDEELSAEDVERILAKSTLTDSDVEQIWARPLPEDWPEHGAQVVNNMRARFPEFPLEGIVFHMKQNGYVGGKVAAAIRRTGAREVVSSSASSVRVAAKDAFPAVYRNRAAGEASLEVYEQAGKAWSFSNMRDRKLEPIGYIKHHERFTVHEVRRGHEYGFCFGRIEFEGQKEPKTWVVLGLLVGETGRQWMKQDFERRPEDLNYSDAERLSR